MNGRLTDVIGMGKSRTFGTHVFKDRSKLQKQIRNCDFQGATISVVLTNVSPAVFHDELCIKA